MRKFVVLIAMAATVGMVMAVTLLACGSAEAADAKVIKLAHLNAQQPFEVGTAAMAAVFKSVVEADSNGALKVEIYPAGQLGNERETMEQVRLGVVQSYIASAGGMATFYPLYSVLDIPFAIPNSAVAWAVFDGEFGKYFASEIEKTSGFKVLGFGDSGFFQLTNGKRPINQISDMQGLKMRTMSLPSHENLMKTYGASPTTIAWAEVYTGLQTGVVDGQHNPIPIILTGKLYEVQKYLTITNHLYSTYCWVVNSDFYKGLTEEEKDIVNAAAVAGIVAGRGLNRVIEASDKGLPALIEAGMEVNTPPPAAMAEFRELGRKNSLEFIEKTFGEEGKQLADRFIKAIDDVRKAEKR
ncbi:MAG: DctP family TRAP transporter solute-binding subunit [Synergistaceae bacterium]|jgi:tripartite ATP-independent transporter DctP family solute receptor|nr:DctP family TRAP transporter solute-binding subunit [Synergistaceae bacterium]